MGVEPITAPETSIVEQPVPPAPPPENVSKHFQALAKKERLLVREREAMKAERAAFEAEKARVTELDKKYSVKPGSPREALQRYGFSYKDATDFELNDGAPSAEMMARQANQEIEQFKQEQMARERQQAENAAKQAQAEQEEIKVEFKTEIKEFANELKDKYELINFHEAWEVVYYTIEEHFNKTGRLLSIPEGCDKVEGFLEKRVTDLQSTKKFAKLRNGEPAQPEAGQSRDQGFQAQRRTLDNAHTSSTPTLSPSPRVEADRIRRALAALG